MLDSCVAGIAYWSVGYAFAYGASHPEDGKTFVGNAQFFLRDGGVAYEVWFFQWAFASAISSIIAGSIAERTQMKAYLLYSTFTSGFVYPVVRTVI